LQATREAGRRPPGLDALLAFEAERARSHYAAAAAQLPRADRRSMLAAEIMGAVYRAVLAEWERRGRPVCGPKLSLPAPRKAWIALRAVPRVYWGL
jgi:phytoene synthase